MIDEALLTWRTREGTALLVGYGAIIAAVSAVLGYMPDMSRAFAAAPQWLRLLPVALPVVLLAAVGLSPSLRRHAHRLQLLNVGVFLIALVLIVLNKAPDRRHCSPSSFACSACNTRFCAGRNWLRPTPERLGRSPV